jgi:hypothetical protein
MGKEKIKYDERNYRRHSDKNKRIIKKSLTELGAGRSILLDADNRIVAGNGVYEQAEQLGIPVKIVETDGKELIAVRRKDLQPDSEQRKKMALLDNHSSDTSDFDVDMVAEDFDVEFLDEIEFPKIESGDIEELDKIVTTYNINIKCDTPEEVEELKQRLGITSNNIHSTALIRLLA